MNFTEPIKFNKNPITSSRKLRRTGKNLFWSFLCPVVMLVVALILSYSNGSGLFIIGSAKDNIVNITSMARTLIMTLIAALALNTNLNSGRMDFALGATGILACLLASLCIGKSLSTIENIFAFLFLSILFGMILGFIHSLVLVFTKLPPIVVSLGMCLVYEGIAKVVAVANGDSGSVALKPGPNTSTFFQEPVIFIPVLIVVMLLMSAALCYTRFGYNKLALVYNQKISVETGINEVLHCIVSFIIAGALIALYQVMSSCGTSSITINTNLASSSTVFQNFLPIFIGGILAAYSNQTIGLLLGCTATTILYKYGFDYGGITAVTSSLLNGFSVFAVLVYMVDKQRFLNWVKMRRYIAKEKYLIPAEPKGESAK